MSLAATSGLNYLNQLKRQDWRSKDNLNFIIGLPNVIPPPIKHSFQNYQRTRWPGLENPNAILQFQTYTYKDFVNTRTHEKVDVRFFILFYYVEDDTIMVLQQHLDRTENINEKYLCRQRIARSDNPDLCLDLWDLNVGKKVIIHGVTHEIYSCEPSTRKVMTAMGFEVPEDIQRPYSQQAAAAQADQKMVQTLSRHINTDRQFAKFLKLDGQVLRFYAIWDDRQSMYGDKHTLVIQYYLADDTLEIQQKTPQVHGRDVLRPFVKRAKIPKRTGDLDKLNYGSPWPVLNAMTNSRGQHINDYHLFDQAAFPDKIEIFTDQDLTTGNTIQVFGKDMFIFDCDDFTRWYYEETYGREMPKYDVTEPDTNKFDRVIPPHNGHGREEDSIQNCYRLVPRAGTKDSRKYLMLDQPPEDPKKLNYKLQMITDDEDDKERNFILTYYLHDDSVYVHEKNSPEGHWPGPHLEKKSIQFGNDPTTTLPEYIQPDQLYMGGIINLREKCFLITEADEATLNYMEKYSAKFPYANINTIMGKIKERVRDEVVYTSFHREIAAMDRNQSGILDSDTFLKQLMKLVGNCLNAQEYQTVIRFYSVRPRLDREQCWQLLRAVIQHACRTQLWEPPQKVLMALKKLDLCQKGFLPKEVVLRALKAARIPVRQSVLLPYLMTIEGEGNICYEDMVQDLDWVKNPCSNVRSFPQQVYGDEFDFVKYFSEPTRQIKYCEFLGDLKKSDSA